MPYGMLGYLASPSENGGSTRLETGSPIISLGFCRWRRPDRTSLGAAQFESSAPRPRPSGHARRAGIADSLEPEAAPPERRRALRPARKSRSSPRAPAGMSRHLPE